jgi:Bax protein
MTDASSRATRLPSEARHESWLALFGIGAAIGVGIVIAVQGLTAVPSLTERLRAERADSGPAFRTRVSVAALPTDLDRAPPGVGDAPPPSSTTEAGRIDGITVAALESEFSDLDYRLREVRDRTAGVPRVVADTVPRDLAELRDVDRRKAVFFKMVLPLVLMVNEELLAERARIQAMADTATAGPLPPEDAAWLARRYQSYRVEPGDLDGLLRKVDAIPPSLALAQAAIESGWGTSRFAREGNALFGQWVWGDNADGIVPEARPDGMTHRIRAFETPLEAVAAYIKNLNTHRAYRDLRTIRAQKRRRGEPLSGMALADGLEAYSEKGADYIRIVRQVISANRLRPLDAARLRDARA